MVNLDARIIAVYPLDGIAMVTRIVPTVQMKPTVPPLHVPKTNSYVPKEVQTQRQNALKNQNCAMELKIAMTELMNEMHVVSSQPFYLFS